MTTYQIVLVDRSGNLKEKKTKNIDTLYKVCNYRNDNHFSMQTTWKINVNNVNYNVQLWAKDDGNAGTENKYDFPPPVDKSLYFGTCCFVNYQKDKPSNLSVSVWKQIYEKLFGGFEDLGDCDSEVSEDSIDEHETTKQGYSKEDNFIVSDDEDCDIFDEDELIEEECSDTDDDE